MTTGCELVGASGWNYGNPVPDGKDARKIVSLMDTCGMVWVGIRAWDDRRHCWLNGGEPESNSITAWRDLPDPAPGYWSHGRIVGDEINA